LPNALEDRLISADARASAREVFASTRAGRERPGRYWKIDLDALELDLSSFAPNAGTVRIDNPNARAIACDLRTAAAEHGALLARAFGTTGAAQTKFGALATAFAGLGAFVYVPADAACDDPIHVTYDIPAGQNVFPYTVVLAERGARATVVEHFDGGDGAFVCAAAEIALEDGAHVTFASIQRLAENARILATRTSRPGTDATVTWATADVGSELSVGELIVAIERPGARAEIASLFFPRGNQHVDIVSTVDHLVGNSTSDTLVKSAATDRGQARYLGNIRIAANAQGSDASLRDDALLLSKNAHIDSVPALEIAANDVKAFHGATVGALDQNSIFYIESRGIPRNEAERMIALAFFEPALDRFPTEKLREELRAALAAKLQ
jgi:Fe-S cluster assembly protein SufD